MSKLGKIALLGTVETKSDELEALSNLLTEKGLSVEPFDLSLDACGSGLSGEEKVRRMEQVALATAQQITLADPVAVVAIGGGTGSEMAMRAMQTVSVDIPKFMITTLPFDPRTAVADTTITMIPTLCDIQGMNPILRRTFARAACMIAGVAAEHFEEEPSTGNVAISLLGVTQAAGDQIIRRLRADDVETTAFHASGYGGAALTRFAEAGLFTGMIDLTVQEVVRMHVAGSHVLMPNRFTCLSDVPRVILPGGLNFFDGGPYDGLTSEQKGRPHYRHSGYFTHVKLSRDELSCAAHALAGYLNKSTAFCDVLLPMGGFSSEDRPGGAIEDPELRSLAADILEAEARAYRVHRLPGHINDPEIATQAVTRLLPHLKNGN